MCFGFRGVGASGSPPSCRAEFPRTREKLTDPRKTAETLKKTGKNKRSSPLRRAARNLSSSLARPRKGARNDCSSPTRAERQLEIETQMARNQCSEPALELHYTRKVPLESTLERRMLDGCRSTLPRSWKILVVFRWSHHRAAECSTGAGRPWRHSIIDKCGSHPQL